MRRPGRRPLIDPTATPQTLASQDRIGPRMMRNAHKRAVAAGGHAVLFQRVGGTGRRGRMDAKEREESVMPEVFTGKVLIPGDQIDAYLAAMREAEEARTPFRETLDGLNREFGAFLEKKYSRKTVRKHTSVVELLIIFLTDYTDVERLEDVTRGMVNSQFRRWYRGKVLDRMDPDETRVALKKFFAFLDQEKGIHNPKALDALR